MGSVADFYDDLSTGYHHLYPDWQAAINEQGRALHDVLTRCQGPGPHRVLDAAAGIGTQLLGLVALRPSRLRQRRERPCDQPRPRRSHGPGCDCRLHRRRHEVPAVLRPQLRRCGLRRQRRRPLRVHPRSDRRSDRTAQGRPPRRTCHGQHPGLRASAARTSAGDDAAGLPNWRHDHGDLSALGMARERRPIRPPTSPAQGRGRPMGRHRAKVHALGHLPPERTHRQRPTRRNGRRALAAANRVAIPPTRACGSGAVGPHLTGRLDLKHRWPNRAADTRAPVT